jgi:hypothetical protein
LQVDINTKKKEALNNDVVLGALKSNITAKVTIRQEAKDNSVVIASLCSHRFVTFILKIAPSRRE